jgi:hypothetical protein
MYKGQVVDIKKLRQPLGIDRGAFWVECSFEQKGSHESEFYWDLSVGKNDVYPHTRMSYKAYQRFLKS